MNGTLLRISSLSAALLLVIASPSLPQVRPPNAAGVFAAHDHLITTNLAASTAFWIAVGGEAAQIGSMNGVRLPGIYILLQMNRGGRGGRGAPPDQTTPPPPPPAPEGTVGSVVDSVGFKVKNLHDTLAKLDSLGVKPESGGTATRAIVTSPERVKVTLTEDASLATACATDETVMKVPNPLEAAAWYAKWFGASVTKDGGDQVAHVPGMNLRFTQTDTPLAGTKGRGLDHIGFDVEDLPALVAKMQDAGVTVNTPYRTINLGFLTGLSFVTDPWGTYIELNQGYNGH